MRNIRQRCSDIENDYNEKKKKYDTIVSQLEQEKERIQEEMGSVFTEYKEAESKFHSNNIQADIFETFQRRMQNEAKFLANGEDRLAPEYKSYSEFFQVKVSDHEDLNFLAETTRKLNERSSRAPAPHQGQHRELQQLNEVVPQPACPT